MLRHHIALAPLPEHHHIYDPPRSTPSPSPSPPSTVLFQSTNVEPSTSSSSSPPSKFPVEFSPPLIAVVVIIAAALVIVTYSRLMSRNILHIYRRFLRWRHRRRRELIANSSSISNIDSPPYPFDPTSTFQVFSPGGLVESAIKSIPLSVYSRKSNNHNCAICLLDFKEIDYVRTLPVCSHDFHVDCIDIWLRSHANCPLCRAVIFKPESPFTPVMANRIRPDLDNLILQSTILEPLDEIPPKADSITGGDITRETSPARRRDQLSEDRYDGRNFLLKRSYSFGFERNLGSERLVTEPVTASPWRYRRGVGSFWRRQSPFNSLTKPRVFSFRSYRGMSMKSPFFRRRGGDGSGVNFYPLSESSARYSGSASVGGGGGGSSRRRSMNFASPMFMRSSAGGGASASASASSGGYLFSSSRLRSGDPEALLSPDRFNNKR